MRPETVLKIAAEMADIAGQLGVERIETRAGLLALLEQRWEAVRQNLADEHGDADELGGCLVELGGAVLAVESECYEFRAGASA